MDAKAILARMAEQRKHWVDLPGGKRLQFFRPQEFEFLHLVGGVRIEHVERYACGWEGFTSADLLGPDGGSDAVDFTPELWAAVLRDRTEYLVPAAQELSAVVTAYLAKRDAAAKN